MHRYAVLRQGESYLDLFNPVISTVDPRSKNATLEESSEMCHVPIAKRVTRHTVVTAQWRDALWKPHSETLNGIEAVCLQHFIDLFNGEWPCSSVGRDAERIPKL